MCENIKTIYIGEKLECIDIESVFSYLSPLAFNFMASLEAFRVSEKNPHFTAVDGVLYSKDLTTLRAYPNAKGQEYTIPPTVTTIGNRAFFLTTVSRITLPENLTDIEAYGFADMPNLTAITLPASLRTIGSYAFDYALIQKIEIPENVTFIDENAFNGAAMESLTIRAKNAEIARWAFNGCQNLTFLRLSGENITLGTSAFARATSLKEVHLKGVSSIGEKAFDRATALKEFYCYEEVPPECHADGFPDTPINKCILYVPTGSKSLYENEVPWKDFGTILEWVPSSLQETTGEKGLCIERENNILRIRNTSPGALLAVYGIDGRQVFQGICGSTTEEVVLPRPGIYLVRCGEDTQKMVW